MKPSPIVSDYTAFLTEVKGRIQTARLQAGRAVNRELVLLYWDSGRGIVEKQQTAGWGEAVVERLAADLRAEFPDMRGFSGGNLRDMRRFFLCYSAVEFWRQAVAKLPDPAGRTGIWRQAVAKQDTGLLQQAVAEIPWAITCCS